MSTKKSSPTASTREMAQAGEGHSTLGSGDDENLKTVTRTAASPRNEKVEFNQLSTTGTQELCLLELAIHVWRE